MFYSITDLATIVSTTVPFPLTEIYRQTTGSRGGSLGLLLLVFIPVMFTNVGTLMTAGGYLPARKLLSLLITDLLEGRMLWTMSRDVATPFSSTLSNVNPRLKNPFNATVACACICTALGAIYVGSQYAFNAFVGSFAVLTTLSYLGAILPHLLSSRRHVEPGYFWMSNRIAKMVHTISSAYIITFVVIFCMPYAYPVTAQNMNYTCLTTGGLTVFVTIWWIWKGRTGYTGPHVLEEVVADN